MNPSVWVTLLVGIGGAVIGAAASIGATWLVLRQERQIRTEQWEREERTRFHKERVQLYAEFQNAATQVFEHHLALMQGAPSDLSEFFLSLNRLTEAQARVSYVATPSVSQRAADLLDVLAVDEGEVNERYYSGYLAEFQLAARDELGVNPGTPSEG